MTRNFVVGFALIALGLTACTKAPEPVTSTDSIPPGAAAPDQPRSIPYSNGVSTYSTDRAGSAPRSGINSDPNNPSGAPGSTITSSTMIR
jgi:hypothetical protein